MRNGQDEIIVNNIIVDNTTWKFENTEPIQNLSGGFLRKSKIMIDHNLCLPASRRAGPHGISADPLFLDMKKGTFYLKKGSPAIGKGSKKYAPTNDFFNRALPTDKTPDLGCFPYDASLLLPQARQNWYHNWPFLFKGRAETMPDLWKPPEPGGPAPGPEQNSSFQE